MSGFETLGGVLNITQIIGVILRHINDHCNIKGVLKEAAERAKRIYESIGYLAPLETLDGAQSNFVTNIVKDFEKIYDQLLKIKVKLENRTTARTILTSPSTLAELKEIESRLAHKEHNIQLMGMMCSLIVKHSSSDSTLQRMSSDIAELKMSSIDMEPAESMLEYMCQNKALQVSTAFNILHRSGWEWLDAMDPIDKLTTGVSFYKGTMNVVDYEKAARYLHAAVKGGKSEGYYYLGMMYRNGQGVRKCNLTAVEMFRTGACANDGAAMTALGQCYLYGVGVRKSRENGVKYVEMGAERGDPIGLSVRSWHKMYGYNTRKNWTASFQLAKKAIEKGNMKAKMALARFYMHGVVVEQDNSFAARLLTEATNAGGYSSITDLAQCYEEGIGVSVNLEKAAELYKKGCEDPANAWRSVEIKPFYGLCLIRGRGIARNVEKGWTEIRSSVQANDDCGWFVQGECYRFGYGVEKNFGKAFESYTRATRTVSGIQGKIRAHYAMGCMYESGEGVVRDLEKSFHHFNFSASNMHRDSQWKVASFCESGTGVEKNEIRAVEYFRLAGNNGHWEAQIKSCKYYMKGKGVQRNLMGARDVLRPAAEGGNEEAKRLLKYLDRKRRIRSKQPFSK